VIPYRFEASAYAPGPIVPARSASASSRKNPSNPAGENIVRRRHHAPLRVRDAARPEGQVARTELKSRVAHLDDVVALQNVERLVLALMDV
jgi:hypothetical protein